MSHLVLAAIICMATVTLVYLYMLGGSGHAERSGHSGHSEHFDIYDHPTRCFDCEQEAISMFGWEYGYLGQKTKSFDAERQMASPVDAHPIRYYYTLTR